MQVHSIHIKLCSQNIAILNSKIRNFWLTYFFEIKSSSELIMDFFGTKWLTTQDILSIFIIHWPPKNYEAIPGLVIFSLFTTIMATTSYNGSMGTYLLPSLKIP